MVVFGVLGQKFDNNILTYRKSIGLRGNLTFALPLGSVFRFKKILPMDKITNQLPDGNGM